MYIIVEENYFCMIECKIIKILKVNAFTNDSNSITNDLGSPIT